MSRNRIDQAIENICLKGCLSVREDIKLLQSGVILPELRDFDELARHLVLQELQSIMAVYGDACPAVRKVPVPNSKN